MRCHLVNGRGHALTDTELRTALACMERAARRLRWVCQWADCELEVSDQKVDRWLRELGADLDAHDSVRGLALR